LTRSNGPTGLRVRRSSSHDAELSRTFRASGSWGTEGDADRPSSRLGREMPPFAPSSWGTARRNGGSRVAYGSAGRDRKVGMPVTRDHRSEVPIVWSRGPGCRELAMALGASSVTRVDRDPGAACIRSRALLMVARKITSFDLCSTAVPDGFDASRVTEVVAAVGSGPHSPLAAAVALRLGHRLQVPVRGVYAHAASGPVPPARRVLSEVVARFPMLRVEGIHAPEPATLVRSLSDGSLLVIGAPGGSWFQRRFFGPGARIRHHAPGGTVVVKAAPCRVYQVMEEARVYGPHLRAADAVALGLGDVVVAVDGRPVGTVSSRRLRSATADTSLGSLAVDVPHVAPEEGVDEALPLFDEVEVSVLPVVDSAGRLLGILGRDDADAPALPWAG